MNRIGGRAVSAAVLGAGLGLTAVSPALPLPDSPAAADAATQSTSGTAAVGSPDAAAPVDPALLYALGVIMSSGIDSFQLSEAEFAQVQAGLLDGYHQRADVSKAMSYDGRLQVLRRTRLARLTEHEKIEGQAYLASVAKLPRAIKTASGLVYVPLTDGRGARPKFNDTVRLNYEGKLVNGSVFDSSTARGAASATLLLSAVMPCFTEGLQLMRAGGKGRLVCPSDLAYGDRGSAPNIRPGATVEYDVELLAVGPAQAPASHPESPPNGPRE